MWFLAACPAPHDPHPPQDSMGTDSGDDTGDSASDSDSGTDSGDDTGTKPTIDRYVDCANGSDGADGSAAAPWATLDRLAAEPLAEGATVWLASSTTCRGTLRLLGSGTAAAPITVAPWGEGAAPIVDAAGADAAVVLRDQSHLTLTGLEITGATTWGVYVAASTQVAGVTLRDLDVHGVHGGAPEAKGTGLVVFTIEAETGWFTDVLVERVQASDTDQWSGIYLYGTAWRQDGPRSSGITFRDNVVHDVGGDGIVVFGAEDALLDANLAYEIGQTPTDDVGTPNCIWTWDCQACTVQWNEAHHCHSPGVDGGAFDIDYDTRDNIVQYNYGHDNDSYCVAIFAAEGSRTTGAVVRSNVCIDNGREVDTAYTGDLFVYSWAGGVVDGFQITNNTVIRTTGYPPLVVWDERSSGVIANNVFVTATDWMATVAGEATLEGNLWWQSGDVLDAWFDDRDDHWYDGLAAWQATGRDTSSLSLDPELDGGLGIDAARVAPTSPTVGAGMPLEARGECDAFGNARTADDIGAHAVAGTPDAACLP